MSVKDKTVWDVIEKFRESASLSARYVGCAPTYEWTGHANLQLLGELDYINVDYTQFFSDVKGQPLFGKKCVKFVTFGNSPE